MPDYGNINEPGAREQFPNHITQQKPRRCNAEAQRRKRTMDTNTKNAGQVKHLVLDNAEVTK